MSDQPNQVTRIGLNQLFLWMGAERFESYPEAFAKLKVGTTYSKESLAKEYGLIYKDDKPSSYPVRSKFLRNFYGLEILKEGKVGIHGINALEEFERGLYRPTNAAIEIGTAFINRDVGVWTVSLAKMIASYEVRTRLLLYLLGKGGGKLVFPNDEFFGNRSSYAQLLFNDGKEVALFSNESIKFNELLQTHTWAALGPFWANEIHRHGYDISQNFHFEGIREPVPSTNKLNSRLKCSMFLMKHLDILMNQGGEWVVNPLQATSLLGEEIAQDFVEVAYNHSPLQRLQQWQIDSQDALGFVIVADLVQRWAEYKTISYPQAEIDFDDWMREQIYQGRVRILETHTGQPRLGRGLFGDETSRKIRYEVIEA